jgi:phosphoglucomutase|nr:phospho-sugar mutase [Merdimmobilis hominis]
MGFMDQIKQLFHKEELPEEIKREYERWRSHRIDDKDLIQELAEIEKKNKEIYERFYTSLSFGTAGLRGILGAGSNRMNIYTVGQATQGLANYLNNHYERPFVAIAYDSRRKSREFARDASQVLVGNGITVWLYPDIMPTPCLSFAVRYFRCHAGINITASHNPAQYNGYKVYGPDGCQITEEAVEEISREIRRTDLFDDVKRGAYDMATNVGNIRCIEQSVEEAYLEKVMEQRVNPGIGEQCPIRIIYTPLNGSGLRMVREVLARTGMRDVYVVPEQEHPDGDFPTCPYPNPEVKEALQLGINLSDELQADLLLATDPDCDRVGIAVRHNGEMVMLTGNQVGVLLLDYIASSRKENGTMPEHPLMVKTIVTTSMVDAVAAKYGVEVRNVLTGFKYIGELIGELEAKGEEGRFLLGFEESYGYLVGSYVRDKDAVVASMLIAEMTAWHKSQGRTLVDALDALYAEVGYYKNAVDSFAFEGSDGMEKMAAIMEGLRKEPLAEIAGQKVVSRADYASSQRVCGDEAETIGLPKSNVLEYGLEGGSSVIIRPSGTEPKIKVYYSLTGEDRQAVENFYQQLSGWAKEFLGA